MVWMAVHIEEGTRVPGLRREVGDQANVTVVLS